MPYVPLGTSILHLVDAHSPIASGSERVYLPMCQQWPLALLHVACVSRLSLNAEGSMKLTVGSRRLSREMAPIPNEARRLCSEASSQLLDAAVSVPIPDGYGGVVDRRRCHGRGAGARDAEVARGNSIAHAGNSPWQESKMASSEKRLKRCWRSRHHHAGCSVWPELGQVMPAGSGRGATVPVTRLPPSDWASD